MKVIKKDGTLEAFDGQKIVNAVTKSASRVMVTLTDTDFHDIVAAVVKIIEQQGLEVRVQSAIDMPKIAETFVRNNAVRHLEKGRVVIFAGGTGNPFFSTYSGAALRAAQINSDVILKATNVDGIYDKDPNKFDDAVKFDKITHNELLERHLAVMDTAAAAICQENNIPILVFNLNA